MSRKTQKEIDELKKKLLDVNSHVENQQALVEVRLSDLNALFELTYQYESAWNDQCETIAEATKFIGWEIEIGLKYVQALNSILNLNDSNTLEDAFTIVRQALEKY